MDMTGSWSCKDEVAQAGKGVDKHVPENEDERPGEAAEGTQGVVEGVGKEFEGEEDGL